MGIIIFSSFPGVPSDKSIDITVIKNLHKIFDSEQVAKSRQLVRWPSIIRIAVLYGKIATVRSQSHIWKVNISTNGTAMELYGCYLHKPDW